MTSSHPAPPAPPESPDDRSQFIRDSMRQSWGARIQAYVEEAAPNTAEHTKVLLRELDARPGERVLDVATGPGVVALAAAMRVGPAGEVIATDLAPEWGAVIAERTAALGMSNVSFRAMGAEALDLPDDSFDVAYCQFGLMFVPEPVRALREMRRVLKPAGRMGIVVWSTPDKVPCFTAITRHVGPLIPPDAPERQLPTPLQLGEPGLIERLAAEAGFANIKVARHTVDFVGNSPEEMWHARVENGQPSMQTALKSLAPDARERLRADVLQELERYRAPDGKLRFPSEAIYVTATKS